MKKVLIVILFFTALVNISKAQSSSINGTIYDASTGETLPGANILLEGTLIGASSDLDGNFTISPIETGTYNLVVSFVSFTTKVISEVKVVAKEPTVLTIMLEPQAQTFDEIVVTATVNRESTNTLLMMQKKSATLSDGISAEAIKRSPDKNVGEVMKRVSGASIQDNKFAVIRGLSDRYNFAMINGSPLPTTEPDRRAFSFDLFPANMIDNLIIIKTATPDLPGEFAGGIIQINTKDIPYSNFYNFSIGTGYNTISTFKMYETYQGGKHDFLGIDDGARALPVDFPDTKTFLSATKLEKVEYSKLVNNDFATEARAASPLSQSYQFSMGHKIKLFKRDLGTVLSLSYSNSRKLNDVERREYNGGDTTIIFHYNDKQYKENILWGALFNIAYKINDNHKISFQNIYNMNAEDMVISRTGQNHEQEQEILASSQQFTSTSLYTSQLNGDHLLPKGIRLKWIGAYALTDRSVPNLRKTYYSRNLRPADETDTVFRAYVPSVASPTYGGKFYSDLLENMYNGIADITVPFKLFNQKQSIKAGTWQQFKDRTFDARVLGYVINNLAKFYSSNGYEVLELPKDQIFAPENIAENRFRLDEITNSSDNYTANSYLNANYLMFDNNFTSKLRVVWGVRVEAYNQKMSSFDYSNNEINLDTTFMDVLPSANLIYSLTEKTNIRLSASRSVTRPEFRELAPFAYYNFSASTAVVGNPNLKSGTIDNFDARVEFYPGEGQLIAVNEFYKRFTNPIEQIVYSGGIGSRTVSFNNVDNATSIGGELEIRKNLSFLSKIIPWTAFEDFTIFTNAALIRSEVILRNVQFTEDGVRPLQGQSPYLFNAGISYLSDKNGWSASALYNIIGRRITEVGDQGYLDIYEAPRSLADFQISKRLFKTGSLKVTISDLLNQTAIFYQDENGNKKFDETGDKQVTGINTGTNISLGFSYKF